VSKIAVGTVDQNETVLKVAHASRQRGDTKRCKRQPERNDNLAAPPCSPSYRLAEGERDQRAGERAGDRPPPPVTRRRKHVKTGKTRRALRDQLHGDAHNSATDSPTPLGRSVSQTRSPRKSHDPVG
jgi:hypothetical protein